MIPSYAIIPTSNRPDVALRCIDTILHQVNVIYVIDNGDMAKIPESDNYYVLYLDRQGELPNLSKIWNLGLELVQFDAVGRLDANIWDVAILNDDVLVPDLWVQNISDEMRNYGCAAASSGNITTIHRYPGPVPLHLRMQGWAFMLAGEKGVRANEDLHWWYGDDDLDWKSRQAGGTVTGIGYPVEHLHPNAQMTPELQVRAEQDRMVFLNSWGMLPW